MFSAKVLADSTNTCDNRLMTMELTYPRFIHSEVMTHRMFSRNAASSRAIPVEKMIEQVEKNPVIPIHWGKAQKGMQAYEVLDWETAKLCECTWLLARRDVIKNVRLMLGCGLHKQIANRLLEPWMWITVIVTGNEGAWNNFFALRCHHEAEPHIQKIAGMAREVRSQSIPQKLSAGQWHLPLIGFIDDDGVDESLTWPDAIQVKVSVGRCARVSYLTHLGTRDVQADIDLHDRLLASKHFSPFEHVAQSVHYSGPELEGNFGEGWVQYRKTLKGEYQCQ
jgi:thymidylate synthase ThyX